MPERFELRPRYQVYSDEELLADVKRVARTLKSSTLGRNQYTTHGRFNGDNIAKRFGGWKNALELAGLSSPQRPPVTDAELLDDLRAVAKRLGTDTLSMEQYKSVGQFSEHPFREKFGTWSAAIRRAGLAYPGGYRARVRDEEYFRNLEQVWVTLGRQPRFSEITKPLSQYSMKAYEHRFGSWRKALEAFVEFVNQSEPEPALPAPKVTPSLVPPEPASPVPPHRQRPKQRTTRVPSHRLRFLVMKRDRFTCQSCGRSPAIHPGVVLHADHILAWDLGGETVLDNLQTLCETCNLGKSNLAP